ncbi:MAG: alcohol dehydrogenase catalytic domain-containing protein [Planctomycetes bacterium]|nr:alcohol dehydrogenase catalytic domain-containing protein [Planctomycetota bacterium]
MKAILYDIKPAGWAACFLLKRFWPGCVLTRMGGLSLRDVSAPQLPGDDWVLVRTLMAGICGTDLTIIAHRQPPDSILQAFSSMPMGLGHENVGIVEQVGKAVDRSWLGKRVCVEPTLCCQVRGIDPPCGPCRAGQFGACENFGNSGGGKYGLPAGTSIGYNARTGGAYGEQFTAHVSQLIAVPDEMTDDLAVMTDPLACSLHAALRADLMDAKSVLVYGSGMLGLGLIVCLRAINFTGTIDVVARGSHAEKFARAMGANEFLVLPGRTRERFDMIAGRTGSTVQQVRFGNCMLSGGYDVVFDCVGTRRSLEESIKWTAARGQIVLLGTAHGGKLDLTPIWFRELKVIGAYGRQIETFEEKQIGTYQLVHELALDGSLNSAIVGLLTHRFRLEDYKQAFRTAINKSASGAVKVAFDFRQK